MKFVISREALLKPLQLVAGVVERRQTLPVLSNVLLVAEGDHLSLTGTDLEVELVGRAKLEQPSVAGSITVPARKLMDICKSLPDGSMIEFDVQEQKLVLRSGRSRFTLSTLPASEFPSVEDSPQAFELTLAQQQLKRLIDRTSFAMAQQDVRYYLNGMLLEVVQGRVRMVATDGHRLATCACDAEVNPAEKIQVIIPRKGVLELVRLISDPEAPLRMLIGSNHIRAHVGDFVFTSKLVDGRFPDYERVVPRNGNKTLLADRQELRTVLQRAAILSNEKYRGVRLLLNPGQLQVFANNPEQEEAEESLLVDYDSENMEIGFNVTYLLDVLNVVGEEQVKIILSDPNSSVLVQEAEDTDSLYVVMPMRL
ncbi:DNA polymerase III subunit beta [Pokkaliibacter plantistimulans]|uniref:Beta sliding clamp n=1 Tax=Pokkaliibacter plantistimulans TaxID=1635171 RepID=A0ABX5LW81_9GAMM|nr:DNA polymerase III subunit beta [Pokkaliibacter plantistimulans]PXF30919.1 DNA polymerase III subunit beta [Pokkaliibacter plantistimulans]